MVPFLKQVAEYYYRSGQYLGQLCFVFPNRRSMVFFSKWLGEIQKSSSSATPIISPVLLTMNDFFYKVSRASTTDRVSLLLELYGCYKELNRNAEPLDDFIFWGDVIMSDFDDTDKYLAEPERLFTNIADFKEMEDTYTYLTGTQKKAIEHFISHFRDGGKLTVNLDAKDPNVKERFLKIWNLLYPLYLSFNKVLRDRNMAYEGMVYRAFAEKLKTESASDILSETFPHSGKFVFVGLNALNECEKVTMRKMRDAGIAEFCWDFSSDMIRDVQNRSTMFMSGNVAEFPQAFDIDNEGLPVPEIKVVSVPSTVGQAKYVPEVLKEIAEGLCGCVSNVSGADPDEAMSMVGRLNVENADTAIVIPDEGLLVPLLNSIPEQIDSVNVTMGYPMSGSEIYGLMNDVLALQMHMRKLADGRSAFYHKQVWSIFSSGLVRSIAGEKALEKASRIMAEAKYYIPQNELVTDDEDGAGGELWLFELIFRPVVVDPKSTDHEQILNLEEYQLDILGGVGAKISTMPTMALETHFAKEYYLSVNQLKSLRLDIMPMTYARLLQQLVGNVSVPFKGEPLKGLQIMGPLETRSLDFTNLIILSCNEGIFPRRNVSSSFIPPELRRGFELPTYENQDAVWAYYFYRMIQRCRKVWLMYDSRTEGLKTGEESRYIKQLEYQYKYPKLSRTSLNFSINIPDRSDIIPKTMADLDEIGRIAYSATSLKNYLNCPAKFYYSSVRHLKASTEVTESMDGGMTGSVFHDVMYGLYTGGEALEPDFDMSRDNVKANVKSPLKEITDEYLAYLIENKRKIIVPKVRTLICRQLKTEIVTGRNLVLERVINQYIGATLACDRKLMKNAGVNKFEIKGLELEKHWETDGFHFIGYLDRMDCFKEGTVRIVDYKTGRVEDNEIKIDDDNAEDVAAKLFAPVSPQRPEIALQLFLYDMFVRTGTEGMTVNNVIYPVPRLLSSMPLEYEKCNKFNDIVLNKLKAVLAELSDPGVGFRRTEDIQKCAYCDFRKICGR